MNIQKIRFKGKSIAGLQLLLLFNQNWEIRYVLQEIIVLYKVEFDISISTVQWDRENFVYDYRYKILLGLTI